MTISYKDAVVRGEVHKANMELVRELVAYNFPEVAAMLRTVNRSSHKDIMLRQIQAKNDPYQLSYLVRENRVNEVAEIIECPHPAMTEGINKALGWAVQNGRYLIAERLLQDPRASVHYKPNGWSFSLLYSACQRGYTDIVDLLLRHGSEVTTADMKEAVFHHHNEVVWQLAPQVDPNEDVLLGAVEGGNWDIYSRIVQYFPDIPVTANTLHWAIYGGNIDIVYDILTNRYVDPMQYVAMEGENAWFNALDTAAQYGQPNIVAMLLENPRVDPSWNRNQAVRLAAKRGLPSIVLQILQHPLPVRRKFLLKWVKHYQQKVYVSRFVNDGRRENHNALDDTEKAVVEYVGGSLADYKSAAWRAIGERQQERWQEDTEW